MIHVLVEAAKNTKNAMEDEESIGPRGSETGE